MYKVRYMNNESGVVLVSEFASPYNARIFVNTLRRNPKYTLISYPHFD